MYGCTIPVHSSVLIIAEKNMFATGPASAILASVPTPGPYLNAPILCAGSMYAIVPVAARNLILPLLSIVSISPIRIPYHHSFCSALSPM